MISKLIDDSVIKQLSALIANADKIVVTCHVAPDGDAIGSSLALVRVLNALGKDARAVVPDTPPKVLRFLPGFKELVIYSQYEEFGGRLISDADLLFSLDYNEPSRTDRMAPAITGAKCPIVMIDHHLFPADFAKIAISRPEVSSTSMLLFHTLCQLGLFTIIDKAAATCIYTGMMTDTGNFSYNSNDPDLYVAISELLKKGIDKDHIYKAVFDCNTPDRLRLNGYALDTKMEILNEAPGAIIALSREELNRYHYKKGDTEGLVNQPLTVPELQFSFYIREEDGYIHLSARSKGEFPVNKICEDHFNGGGHKNAAGGKYFGTLEQAAIKIKEIIPDYIQYLPSQE